MAKNKRYRPVDSKDNGLVERPNAFTAVQRETEMSVSCYKIAEIAIDIWRLGERVKAESANERIMAAWERADARLGRLGFKLDTMQDRPYDDNLRVRVVEHESGDGVRFISECLTPAVFFNGVLIREAEVITRGGA